MITTAEMWLKDKYFPEYMCALLRNTKMSKKSHTGTLAMVEYINYCRRSGVEVKGPDINSKCADFWIDESGSIVFGLRHVKNVASAADNIVEIVRERPFENMADFCNRCVYETTVKTGVNAGKKRKVKPNKKVVESLLDSGAFDQFGSRSQIYFDYQVAALDVPEWTEEEWEETRKKVCPEGCVPDVNDPESGLDQVKGCTIAGVNISHIVKEEPFESMAGFHERAVWPQEIKSGKNEGQMKTGKPTKTVMVALIASNAFRDIGPRDKVIRDYYVAKGGVTRRGISEDAEIQLERDMIGVCLSRPPLYREYEEMINENKWSIVGSHLEKDKPTVFGRLTQMQEKVSKAGNPMLLCTIDDGMDQLDFFVFRSSIDFFRDRAKKGLLVAVPMNKFNDSTTRFYNDSHVVEVIKEDRK